MQSLKYTVLEKHLWHRKVKIKDKEKTNLLVLTRPCLCVVLCIRSEKRFITADVGIKTVTVRLRKCHGVFYCLWNCLQCVNRDENISLHVQKGQLR